MSNTAITVAMEVQGNAAFTTQGGLWKMNFEEGITHFLEGFNIHWRSNIIISCISCSARATCLLSKINNFAILFL
jgi:hypothetical protein